MQTQLVNYAEVNKSYQRDMAASLAASLGLDEALEFCLEAGWEGVLRVLIKQRELAAADHAADHAAS